MIDPRKALIVVESRSDTLCAIQSVFFSKDCGNTDSKYTVCADT